MPFQLVFLPLTSLRSRSDSRNPVLTISSPILSPPPFRILHLISSILLSRSTTHDPSPSPPTAFQLDSSSPPSPFLSVVPTNNNNNFLEFFFLYIIEQLVLLSVLVPTNPQRFTSPWDTAVGTSFGTSSFEFSFVVPPPLPSPNQLPTATPGLTFSEGSSVVSDFELVDEAEDLDLELVLDDGEEKSAEMEAEVEEEDDDEEEMVLVTRSSEDQVGLGLGGLKGGKVDELSSMLRRTHLPSSQQHPHRQQSWTEEEELDMGGLFD
ncbi:hypothetical protein BDY24DRAFT_415414 [Mrakia frigida]|uniref:uncharacterized protein n=1 Tax=Mrakia frigida TaxID=29902 RepID=UPI003FCBF31A